MTRQGDVEGIRRLPCTVLYCTVQLFYEKRECEERDITAQNERGQPLPPPSLRRPSLDRPNTGNLASIPCYIRCNHTHNTHNTYILSFFSAARMQVHELRRSVGPHGHTMSNEQKRHAYPMRGSGVDGGLLQPIRCHFPASLVING